jgi:AsmA protein
MLRIIRASLYAIAGLIALAVLGLAIFFLTFDPNQYKAQIQRYVTEQTGRTLTLEGDLQVAIYPNLGASLGAASLSDKNSAQPFASIESAHISVALLPLLRGQTIVNGVDIVGLQVNVERSRQGRLNFEDLLDKASPKGDTKASAQRSTSARDPLAFDVTRIRLEKATLAYKDLGSGQHLVLHNLQLQTGRLAVGAKGELQAATSLTSASPKAALKLSIKTDYTIGQALQSVLLSDTTLDVRGELIGFKNIEAQLRTGATFTRSDASVAFSSTRAVASARAEKGPIKANFSSPGITWRADILQSNSAELTASISQDQTSIDAAVVAKQWQMSGQRISVSALSTDLTVKQPSWDAKGLTIKANGKAQADLSKQTWALSLDGALDGAPLKFSIDGRGFDKPALGFDLEIATLNLDRYMAPAAQTSVAGSSTGQAASQAFDLSALRALSAKGRVRLQSLRSRELNIQKINAVVNLSQGRLEVTPLSAELLGGKTQGSVSVDSANNQFQVKQTATDISLQALTQTMMGQERLSGRGNLSFDLSANGATPEQVKRTIRGTANVIVRDGSIKGVDVGAILRSAQAALGRSAPTSGQTTSGQTSGSTDFAEASASATITNGIATNKDLTIKAPLFRLEGNGTINIPESRLDYNTRVAIVETSHGQGGAELSSLRGLTVPLRISGPFDQLSYRIDMAALAAEIAKSRASDAIRGPLDQLLGPGMTDKLKGLFGR